MKKHEITTRVGAVILAASMIVGEAVPAFAAEKTVADGALAAVSVITAGEAEEIVPESTETEETEISETEDTEEVFDVEDVLLADEVGVSTVIGLEGETEYIIMSSDDNKVQVKYVYADQAEVIKAGSIELNGAPIAADANGLYNVNGRFYSSVYYSADGNYTRYSNDITDYIITTVKPVYNEQTGLYDFNGKSYIYYNTVYSRDAQGSYVYDANGSRMEVSYYINPNDEVTGSATVNVTAEGSYLNYSDIQKAVGKKISDTDTGYRYYEIGGKTYEYIGDYRSTNIGNNTYTVTIYGTRGSEISFDKRYQRITWNYVSNETEAGANGKVYEIGYQVEVDGVAAVLDYKTAEGETFTTSTYFSPARVFAVGEQAIYRVKAVYYTKTTDAVTGAVTYAIVAKGDWSEAYAYVTEGDKVLAAVPTVTGVTAALKKNSNTTYEVNWSAVADANRYSIQVLSSAVALDPAVISEYTWNNKARTVETWNGNTYYSLDLSGTTCSYYVETTAEDEDAFYGPKRNYYKYVAGTATDYDKTIEQYNPATGKNERVYVKKEYCDASDINVANYDYDTTQMVYYKTVDLDAPYVYIRVAARVTYENEIYVGTRGAYSAAAAVQLNNIALEKEANIPAVTGFKVENQTDGSFTLKWNPLNDGAKMRIYYTTDAAAFADGSYLYKLADPYDSVTGKKFTDQTGISELVKLADKRISYKDSLDPTSGEISSDGLDLEYGKKYYFIAVTYDSTLYNETRAPYVVWDNVAYVNYTDISAPTAAVSATRSLGTIFAPSTKSEKESITMTFGANSNITGYEIYRKSGKKYTKIATTTSRQYVDNGLKADTAYQYKVIAYNYNPVTKKTYKSDAVFFSAETSTNNYIDVKVTASSKTAAKVTWTKVTGATKYEIYRTNTYSADNNLSKSNSTGNDYTGIVNKKWTLVKTITNAKTTSYTDKKLTAGETYTYQVVATYTSGKATKQITDLASIALKISAPSNVKATLSGKKVKVTWTADKYAKKYEVRYKVYNAQSKAYNDDWTVKSLTKAAYTIPTSLKSGEYVKAQVRATDGKKWTSWSSVVDDTMVLAAVKGVKAVNTTVKDANGVESAAVKVSWKSVSGAKYYKVYRSTSPAVSYNADEKVYVNYSAVPIAKESNNDENNSIVYYDEYKGYSNTVTGTSVIDRGQLQPGVEYYYFVCAYAENGTAVSYGISANTSVVFNTVASFTAKAAKGKVTLTIKKTTGATSYVVYRSTKKNGTYTKLGSTKKTSYVDKTAKKGTTYYYKVVATGTNGLKADFAAESAAVKVKAK